MRHCRRGRRLSGLWPADVCFHTDGLENGGVGAVVFREDVETLRLRVPASSSATEGSRCPWTRYSATCRPSLAASACERSESARTGRRHSGSSEGAAAQTDSLVRANGG